MSGTNVNEFGQAIGRSLPEWSVPPMPDGRVLHGMYCRLEPMAERFIGELHAANERVPDAGAWTYLPYGPFATEAAYRHWALESCFDQDPLFYVITDASDGRALGLAAYLRIQPSSGSIEVGHLKFSSLLQRSRASTEAMYLMMKHAFEIGYRRYEWKADALNAPSRSAAERLGFSFEGIFRQATVYKGRTRDTAWYSVIDTEWPVLREAFSEWLDPANFDSGGRQRATLGDWRSAALRRR